MVNECLRKARLGQGKAVLLVEDPATRAINSSSGAELPASKLDEQRGVTRRITARSRLSCQGCGRGRPVTQGRSMPGCGTRWLI